MSKICTLTPFSGDIVAQADQSATLTWTASYEAYGKRTKETGTNQDKQRANSKDEDPTGLLNEGFRYRDIETGVWLSRDPAGFVDGPNVYAYVMQNPWTSFDPDGLAKKSQLHKERRGLIQRRDAEKAIREKNGETQTVLGINAQGDGAMVPTEFGEAMNAFNTAIDRLESRIAAIDRAVDVHNGALDAMGALTGGKHSSHRLSRVQFDDEDPKNQVFLRNGNRAIDLRDDVALTLLGAGAGKLISVGGKAMRLLSPAAKTAGYSDDLLRAAQKEFPGKAGKIEMHHIEPKYLGGDPNGPLAPLDAAYHQQITNEFRRLAPYGQTPPCPTEVQRIMQEVYKKYPLPPAN